MTDASPLTAKQAFEACSERARQIAQDYTLGSDGRNTFIILAEWADAQALATPSAQSQGAGDWILVPREPTPEMQEAAEISDREYTLRQFGNFATVRQGPYDTYVAMLAAAPSPQPTARSTYEEFGCERTWVNRDWPEDASHENGNYECICRRCGNHFVGHKRRVVCKLCAPQPEASGTVEDAAQKVAGTIDRIVQRRIKDSTTELAWHELNHLSVASAIIRASARPGLTDKETAAIKWAKARLAACRIAFPSVAESKAATIREFEAVFDVLDRLTPQPKA